MRDSTSTRQVGTLGVGGRPGRQLGEAPGAARSRAALSTPPRYRVSGPSKPPTSGRGAGAAAQDKSDLVAGSLSFTNPLSQTAPPAQAESAPPPSATEPPQAATPRSRKPTTPAKLDGRPSAVPATITIHVLDESRKVRKDFRCPRDVLIREMKYFAGCLSNVAKLEGIDISVHCDVKIFDWLMKYVKAKVAYTEKPGAAHVERAALTIKNVVSILVSSDFLKMDALVNECLAFCRKHLNAVVSSPSNISCVTNKLLSRLAALLTLDELRNLVDDSDKIKSKIFWLRLEQLFSDKGRGRKLFRCAHCKRVLSQRQSLRTPCVKRGHVSNDGSVLFVHTVDPTWDTNEFIAGLKRGGAPAASIFWHVIELLHYFRCRRCDAWFPYAERKSCRYCPQVPAVVASADAGPGSGADFINDGAPIAVVSFGCCGRRVPRFQIDLVRGGCMTAAHDFDPDTTADALADVTIEFLHGVATALGGETVFAVPPRPDLFWEEECASEPPLLTVATGPLAPGGGEAAAADDSDAGARQPATPRKTPVRRGCKAVIPFVAARDELLHDNSYIPFGLRAQPAQHKQNAESSLYKFAIDRNRANDIARMNELQSSLMHGRSTPPPPPKPRGPGSARPFTSVEARLAALTQQQAERRKKEADAEKRRRKGGRSAAATQ